MGAKAAVASAAILAGVAYWLTREAGPEPSGSVKIRVEELQGAYGLGALVTVFGTATAGAPVPSMLLEIYDNGVLVSSRSIGVADVVLNQAEEHSVNITSLGSHAVYGRLELTNEFGTFEKTSNTVEFDIGQAPSGDMTVDFSFTQEPGEQTVYLQPLCDVSVDQGTIEVRDDGGIVTQISVENEGGTLVKWGFISFDLSGITGITEVELGLKNLARYRRSSGQYVRLWSSNPFLCPFLLADAPNKLAMLWEEVVPGESLMIVSGAPITGFCQQRENEIACFQLDCIGADGYWIFSSKEGVESPYLKVTFG